MIATQTQVRARHMSSFPVCVVLPDVPECDDGLLFFLSCEHEEFLCSQGGRLALDDSPEGHVFCWKGSVVKFRSEFSQPNTVLIFEGNHVEVYWAAMHSWWKAQVLHILGKDSYRVQFGNTDCVVIADVARQHLRLHGRQHPNDEDDEGRKLLHPQRRTEEVAIEHH
jgi:hypothetical protein